VHAFHSPGAGSPFRYCSEAFHFAAISQPAEQTKVPHLIFAQTSASAWSEGTGQKPHPCRDCHETAQPQLGLSPHRPADFAGFRSRYRQGCGAPNPERSLPPGTGFGRSFLAYVSRPCEGQLVELRSVPLRIGYAENSLDSRSDGPIHPSHDWVRRPLRHRSWNGTVPDVPPGHCRAQSAQIPQFGP
jgi:hypothetical protein